ncbi:MAG TPA: membrane dipeptidase [Rhizomicrobium sp.]|nr:membrane dipeptidase [Rhizomicrobium sp.]
MRDPWRRHLDRRTALALFGASAACAAAAPAFGRAAPFTEADYARAIVIDGEGVTGGSDDDKLSRDLAATGMTAVSVTAGRVDNAPGAQVIHELNAQHIVLDLSHGGARTIAEATALTTAPPAVTHTGCRALTDNPRNISDALMRNVADKGGVVGIYIMSYLATGVGRSARDPRREDIIAHLEHALQVCGEDHVGIGTDGTVLPLTLDAPTRAFLKRHYEDRVSQGVATPGDGPEITNTISEYNASRRFLAIGEDLSRRGWPASRVEKIIGGNFARLFRDVWSN